MSHAVGNCVYGSVGALVNAGSTIAELSGEVLKAGMIGAYSLGTSLYNGVGGALSFGAAVLGTGASALGSIASRVADFALPFFVAFGNVVAANSGSIALFGVGAVTGAVTLIALQSMQTPAPHTGGSSV